MKIKIKCIPAAVIRSRYEGSIKGSEAANPLPNEYITTFAQKNSEQFVNNR